MSSRPKPRPTGSLMPQHSMGLASQLSSHLHSAVATDLSYAQMNDAKIRGMTSLASWDQFHGMVLTSHLQPVNLRTDPIDGIANGIARHKKIEAANKGDGTGSNNANDDNDDERMHKEDEDRNRQQSAFYVGKPMTRKDDNSDTTTISSPIEASAAAMTTTPSATTTTTTSTPSISESSSSSSPSSDSPD